jgi:hypothetical protein
MRMISFARSSYLMETPVIRVSPFGDHIGYVVLLCPREKVSRIDARWIIAAMKNLDTIRDGRPMVKLPGYAMGKFYLPVLSAAAEHSIPMMDLAPCPNPARIGAAGFIDLGPETFFNRDALSKHATSIKGEPRDGGGCCLGNQRLHVTGSINKKSAERYQLPRQPQYSTSGERSQA